MISRSRSRARVGFSSGRWKGAMKMPNFILAGTVIARFPSQSRRQQLTQYHLRSDVVLLELITQLAGRNAQQGGGAGLYTAATAQGLEQAFALDVSHSLGQGRGRGFGKEYPGRRRRHMDIDRQGDILGRNYLPAGHDHHTLDTVLQFADIARPVIADDQVHGGGRDLEGLTILGIEALQEVPDQEGNIFPALAQRWQHDGHYV